MIHRIPSGTRDVLPDEMRELRAITDALRGVFERHGYGEVYTPTIEYERRCAAATAGVQPAYRVFDDHGDVLALRSDMTVPIARVVATRYAAAEPPLRFCYVAHAYRQVRRTAARCASSCRPGIELVGAPGAAGHGRGADGALPRAGRRRPRGLPRRPRRRRAVPGAAAPGSASTRSAASGCSTSSPTRDFVGLEREVARARRWRRRTPTCSCACRSCAAGPTCSTRRRARWPTRCAGCATSSTCSSPRCAERVIFDLGLARGLGYYTGAVFDVYDPALGEPLGGGGRYDDLLGRFGRALPAVGFALGVDRLHLALAGEER